MENGAVARKHSIDVPQKVKSRITRNLKSSHLFREMEIGLSEINALTCQLQHDLKWAT